MDDILKTRIKIDIVHRLVLYIAGYNVSIEWGSAPGSDGAEEAKRLFELKCSDMAFEDLHDEIFREFLFRLVMEQEKQVKKRMTMQRVTGENNEERRKIYKDSHKTYKAFKDDIVLNKALESISNNHEIEESSKVIDEAWEAILNGEDYKVDTPEMSRMITEALSTLEKQKNDSKYDHIDLDTFKENTLTEAIDYINSNAFKSSEMNQNEITIIKQMFEAKIKTQNPKNIRARAKDTIYDKVNKEKITSLSLYEFDVGLLEIIGMYRAAAEGNKPKMSTYLIETQYNLALYIIVAFEIMGLGIKDREISGFLTEIQGIFIYANYLNGYKNISSDIHIRYLEIEEGTEVSKSPLIASLKYKFDLKEKVIWDMLKNYTNDTTKVLDIKDNTLPYKKILRNLEVIDQKITLLENMLLEQSTEVNKVSVILKKIMNQHKQILKVREEKIKNIIKI